MFVVDCVVDGKECVAGVCVDIFDCEGFLDEVLICWLLLPLGMDSDLVC